MKASTHFQKAMKLYREKSYPEAISEFRRTVKTDSQNAAAWYFMGYAHFMMDQHRESFAAFEEAFEVEPRFDPRPYFSHH